MDIDHPPHALHTQNVKFMQFVDTEKSHWQKVTHYTYLATHPISSTVAKFMHRSAKENELQKNQNQKIMLRP